MFKKLDHYKYEHIFIDNASIDDTVKILKNIALTDSAVKIIVNTRNFGPIRSPYYGLLQCRGDAIIFILADLQDPVSMIVDFIKKWEAGNKIVIGIKIKSDENRLMFFIRKMFYYLISKISETALIKNFTGFGLYDKDFMNK